LRFGGKYIEMTLRENLVEKVSFVFGNGMYGGYLVRTKLLEFGLMGTFKGRWEWEGKRKNPCGLNNMVKDSKLA
jgi:hypothetical protein